MDAPMGPKAIHSAVLTADEEAMVVASRRHTLLSLDDCLYALQPTIPSEEIVVAPLPVGIRPVSTAYYG